MMFNIETKLQIAFSLDLREAKKLRSELIEVRKKESNGKDLILIDSLIKSLNNSLDERQLY